MEGEIVNQFPLALCGTGLEGPEPVVDPVTRQLLGIYSYVSLGMKTFIHVGGSHHATRCMLRLDLT